MNPKIIIARQEADSEELLTSGGQAIIRKRMTVLHSTHPRFVSGTKFDYGFVSMSLDDGYVVTILPLP